MSAASRIVAIAVVVAVTWAIPDMDGPYWWVELILRGITGGVLGCLGSDAYRDAQAIDRVRAVFDRDES